jgi:hypothetical protein
MQSLSYNVLAVVPEGLPESIVCYSRGITLHRRQQQQLWSPKMKKESISKCGARTSDIHLVWCRLAVSGRDLVSMWLFSGACQCLGGILFLMCVGSVFPSDFFQDGMLYSRPRGEKEDRSGKISSMCEKSALRFLVQVQNVKNIDIVNFLASS